LTDPNTISNSDTNPKDNNTSSDESLSGDNISTDLNSITDHPNEASDTDHSNKSSAKTKLRKNSSWVWHKKAPNGQRECGQLVKTQGSTSNFQTHLNSHRITKPTKAVEIIAQPTINEMFHRAARQNTHQKESINHALVKWIVTNLQPLYVLKMEYLKTHLATEIKTQPQNTDSLVEKVKESLHIALNHYWDTPLDCSLIAMLLDLHCKSMRKLDSWEHDKAVDLLRQKYNLLSTENENINNLVNVDQNKNQTNLFSIMFGPDTISASDKNEVDKYLK
ncbi:1150_t:CDS:2, partial [Gigaspora margarita]